MAGASARLIMAALPSAARVKGDWLVPCPRRQLTTPQPWRSAPPAIPPCCALMALEEHGVKPHAGDVLVTGAAGGVGSIAIVLSPARLSRSSPRPAGSPRSRPEGARRRRGHRPQRICSSPVKPLAKARWAGAVDAVGSTTLANVLSQIDYGGTVAACGLAQGMDLPTSVAPFILRGVKLIGINSVTCPTARRRRAWSAARRRSRSEEARRDHQPCEARRRAADRRGHRRRQGARPRRGRSVRAPPGTATACCG